MSAHARDYGALLAEKTPEVIRDEEQSRRYTRMLEKLLAKGELSPAEQKLAELLVLLIEDFESKHYQLPAVTPVEIIRHLMEANELRQKDLTDVFSTESIASEVLNGKRELNKEHIKRLSRKFGVSPAVFF
jgi:HTH-type transcriptional regulator/antitoxin HigA